ncbi:MAG TPA: protein kinase [Isosphaeraceae bacterium]|jgi:serine/threonine protein kinase/tetratricopeptide (TPR) repeat protein|nr:protein kinase [Isosphaeraceae bacterium]
MAESTTDRGAEWDGGVDSLAQAWDPAATSAPPPPGATMALGPGRGPSRRAPSRPFADFSLRLDGEPVPTGLEGPPTVTRTAPRAGPTPDAVEPTFPKPGQAVGGFRLVAELGRGALGRVFLAEQEAMADRRVALKITKVEGDEYRALSRLQHAHIVPIHSVHDDPATGLRLLCMPYLGGANLAQVLEAAGARLPTVPTGRSLVDALDQVRAKPGPVHEAPTIPSARLGAAVTRGIGSPSLVRSIWRRHLVRMPWWGRLEPGAATAPAPAGAGTEDEPGQPARRFLRNASYVQAAAWIAARLAEGLDHAHGRGLLHRDIKPSNILITADGTPMLLDFNLAAAVDVEGDGDRALVGGTLPYMAPEHLDAFNPRGATPPTAVDERSDIYALGLILFEMLAGRHPFGDPPAGLPIVEVLGRMTAERRRGAPPLRAINPQVPRSLESIVRKCLDPEPARRYRQATDLAEDLRRFLDDLPLRHAPEPCLRERLQKWARRNPKATSASTVAAVAAALIVACAALLWALRDHLELVTARLRRARFEGDFRQCQLLLNATAGPVEHLGRGIDLADRELAAYGILGPGSGQGDWSSSPLVRRLDGPGRRALREELAELLVLEARARVELARRGRDEVARRNALRLAIRHLDRAEAIDPRPSAALFEDRADYRRALGDGEGFERDRDRASTTEPATARDFALRGSARLARGRLDEAERDLARAVALDPKRFWAWFALGLCHLQESRLVEAAADFSVCSALAPEFAWPHLNRGLALARAGRLTEAHASYDRAIDVNPWFIEAFVDRGLTCLELGDAVAAERDLRRAIELGSKGPSIRAAHAEALARLGRRDEAGRGFAEALRVRPDDPALLVARGFFRLPTDPDGARADLDHALAVDPRDARAHLGLAHLARKSDPRAALAELDRALELDPSLLDALELRALLRARLGDPSALPDVDRLLLAPNPRRLYNAACTLARLSSTTSDPRLLPRALDLLRRSLAAGYPSSAIATDADLQALRALPEFRALAAAAHR